MRGLVPEEILDRKDKVGFAVPAHTWIHSLRDWVEGSLHATATIPALRSAQISALAESVFSASSPPQQAIFLLWRLVGLALCVPRMFLVDLHSTLYRIVAFGALGAVLLWVGFSYHRFRHLIAEDVPPSPMDPDKKL